MEAYGIGRMGIVRADYIEPSYDLAPSEADNGLDLGRYE
jgi:hypothetical protein